MNAVRILARLNGASIDETGSTTSRPFHQPVPMGQLAGRGFHPVRRTPMHAWHLEAGAEMFHAGAWLRPAYYCPLGKSVADQILEDALAVRKAVGLIDVSTLGKLWINGPDAARFLEQIYTGRYANLPIGRLRYALACDETGVIIEDGVVARIAEDRFYVTATSSGAAAFYRELQRWALIFEMDVVLANSTGHMAAMNLAGPRSREVLQGLTDIDLSPEAFPYLAVREGTVAGMRAIVLRVGFVGELGYEIHVPASAGLHAWKSLMDAGQPHGIAPFGVEAQRLLRLEKGHLIVGQDTDALTNPFEADVAWAIAKNKPFFIGQRSLEIARRKPLTRRLVGFTFSFEDHSTSLVRGLLGSEAPQECNLIITNGDIAGRVTSVALRTIFGAGRGIGLAFVLPEMASPGMKIHIRLSSGRMFEAEVAKIPFYDPDNLRQQ
jgi:sarcosine oxidase subunit alpha